MIRLRQTALGGHSAWDGSDRGPAMNSGQDLSWRVPATDASGDQPGTEAAVGLDQMSSRLLVVTVVAS